MERTAGEGINIMSFLQGDIIKIAGFKNRFLVISKNAFISKTNVFHVCPIMAGIPKGPLHIVIKGENDTIGTALCEQIKLIDPSTRNCSKTDCVPYEQMMNISDAIQGVFECD